MRDQRYGHLVTFPQLSVPVTNWWLEASHLECLPTTTSMYSSNVVWSWPPSAFLNSPNHGFQVCTIMASSYIFKLASSPPPSSHNHNLQLHLQTCSITASTCISELTGSWPASSSPNSIDSGLQVYLWVHSILASKIMSQLAWSQAPSASLGWLNHHLQAHLDSLWSTAFSQSRYTVCRFGRYIDTSIHRYMDENTNWIHEFETLLNNKL